MSRSVIVSTARTPFGRLGGGLAAHPATELGAIAIRAGARARRDRAARGRVRDHGAGAPGGSRTGAGDGRRPSAPAFRRRCPPTRSTRSAPPRSAPIEIADLMIRAGGHEVVVTGGMESMSNAPYLLHEGPLRLPARERRDARSHGLRRADVDLRRLAHGRAGLAGRRASSGSRARSRTRGRSARTSARPQRRIAGRFADEIVAVGDVEADESVRRDTTLEKLASLAPVFDPEGTTTAGNAPGVNDGALVRHRLLGGVRAAAWPRAARDDRRQGYVADDFAYLARTPAKAGAQALAKAGSDDRRRQARRDQRGLRVGREQLDADARRRRGDRERERRCDRARASDRSVGRPDRGDARARASPLRAVGSVSPRSAPAAGRATRCSSRSECPTPLPRIAA